MRSTNVLVRNDDKKTTNTKINPSLVAVVDRISNENGMEVGTPKTIVAPLQLNLTTLAGSCVVTLESAAPFVSASLTVGVFEKFNTVIGHTWKDSTNYQRGLHL